jgi:hypothetical protein
LTSERSLETSSLKTEVAVRVLWASLLLLSASTVLRSTVDMFDFGVEDYERLAAKKPLGIFCSDDQNNKI